MRIKQTLLLGVAVAAAAAYLTITPLSAQVTVIDNDDIGGVVTGPSGPEAGVWVIAETTDLGTKMSKMVVTDDQGRYVHPRSAEGEIQGVGARLWAGRFRQGRQRARQAAQPDRREGAQREGGGRILSGDLLVLDDQGAGSVASSRAPGRPATASTRTSRPRASSSTSSRPTAASTCHQLGNKATRDNPGGARQVRERP